MISPMRVGTIARNTLQEQVRNRVLYGLLFFAFRGFKLVLKVGF